MSAIQERPHRHAITVEEYTRMGQAGVFAPQTRLELMEGEIIEMAPIGSAHAAVVRALAALLRSDDDRFILSVQDPLILDERSAPQPDLMVLVTRPGRYFDAHPRAADVLLVVEVSDSTLEFDLNTKVPLYAAAGVVEVWVIDVSRRSLHVFRKPRHGRYDEHFEMSGEGAVTATHIECKVRLTELFPQDA